MQEKIKPSKGSAIRKGWGSTSNILPQVLPNKMGASNSSSLRYLTKFMLCSMVENLLRTCAMVLNRSSQYSHIPRESPNHSQQVSEQISTIFWEGKVTCPHVNAKIWRNVHCHFQGQHSPG